MQSLLQSVEEETIAEKEEPNSRSGRNKYGKLEGKGRIKDAICVQIGWSVLLSV